MTFETNQEKGRAGLAMAIGYFGSHGYTVSIPLNDTQWYDLVIEKDNKFQTVQCKATGAKNNQILFTSCGGTKGEVYDSLLNHPVDLLFCLDKEQNIFIIPVEDIRQAGNTKSITLNTAPNINKQGFETYRYWVSIIDEQPKPPIIEEKYIYLCSQCGEPVSKKGRFCIKCANKQKSTPLEDMPVTRDELKRLIRTTPFTTIGSDHGVSDNAIRKWCIKYDLPTRKTDIKQYTDEEWQAL